MTIEIYSPNLHVREDVLKRIEKKVMTLSHLSEKISRAEIFLTGDSALRKQNKVCKLRLDIFGDTLFVRRNAESFEKAAGEAIKILKGRLKKKTGYENKPPDEVISTVEV